MDLTVEEAIKYLKTPGTRFSGSDWKYGWPHKFYIEIPDPEADKEVEVGWESGPGYDRAIMGKKPSLHLRFYTRTLETATPEELAEFDLLSRKIFGIRWRRDEKGIKYTAPHTTIFGGWQRYGTIGPDGEPIHEDGHSTEAVLKIITGE